MTTPTPPKKPLTPETMTQTHTAAFELTRPWSAREFSDLMASATCFVFGNTQCFALVRIIADEAELLTIATHPDNQRQGRAKNVMDTLHLQLQELGVVQISLEVAAPNLGALALYESLSYRRVGSRRGYYPAISAGKALDAIVMQLKFPI